MQYLPDPNAFLKKFLTDKGKPELATGVTKMTFHLADEQQRKDVIAYIDTFSRKEELESADESFNRRWRYRRQRRLRSTKCETPAAARLPQHNSQLAPPSDRRNAINRNAPAHRLGSRSPGETPRPVDRQKNKQKCRLDRHDHEDQFDKASAREQLSHRSPSNAGDNRSHTSGYENGPFKRTTVRLRNAANETHSR